MSKWIELEPGSPVPLYHQIAEAIRYRIATGRITPGEVLPPLREAARDLGVNLHTVRRAYAALRDDGLVEFRGAGGTRVIGSSESLSKPREAAALDRFVARTAASWRQRFGREPAELGRRLLGLDAAAAREAVTFVECSQVQCLDHIAELEAAWDVSGRPFVLSEKGEPPEGAVVATYFHFNEIRRRWPRRLSGIHFAAIRPDPTLPDRVLVGRGRNSPTRLVLCERDASAVANIAADLSVLFPPESFRIETRVIKRAGSVLATRGRTPVLFSPRVWATLTEEEQGDPRAHQVTYVFAGGELEKVGRQFGWRPKTREAQKPGRGVKQGVGA